MLRFFANDLRKKSLKLSTSSLLQYRSIKYKTAIGGGLEKLQGGLKEEKYFYKQNNDLMVKIKEQGARDERTSLRDTCSANKHKNCLEEAFFLDEQNECCVKLCKEDTLIKDKVVLENFIK